MCHDGAKTCLISNFLSNLIDLLIGRLPRQVPVHPVHGILALHDEEEYNGDVLLVQDVSQVLVTGNMERMGGKNLARQAGETSHGRNVKLCGGGRAWPVLFEDQGRQSVVEAGAQDDGGQGGHPPRPP